ncbi:MAG TPA: amidohydrolase family protein [Nitrososphaeraceae archaeon]|nr:amidohydrolase family protein [Nitrososphaeraceae archaeon]
MTLIIRNISLLYGKELVYINKGFICINKNGIIIEAGSEDTYFDKYKFTDRKIYDGTGFLAIPGFINSHTHIADSIGKDISFSSTFNEMIHPVYGIKKKILNKSTKEHLKYFIRTSAISMMIKGTISFVDFREGGPEGIELLKDSIGHLPIKSVILGRVEQYFDLKKILEIKKQTKENIDEKLDKLQKLSLESLSRVLELSDGLGLSGANENTDNALKQYTHKVKEFNKNNYVHHKKKIIAIHAAESKSTLKFSKLLTGKTEVERIINFLKPDILIHMTHATLEDLTLALHNNIGIVLCPRSNGILGNGIPDIVTMVKLGFKISIGTDNIMINSPDLLQELDYLWKVIKSHSSKYSNYIDPKELLKMITVNPGEIFGLNSGSIDIGKYADILFIDKYHIDLQPIHNIYSSIIHRLSYDAIKGIMINGRFINETPY